MTTTNVSATNRRMNPDFGGGPGNSTTKPTKAPAAAAPTPAPQAAAAAATAVQTRKAYVDAVLKAGGWPVTSDNEQFLLNLAQREHAVDDSSPSAAFNLFNSEQQLNGSSYFNHTSKNAGVQNYATFEQGVQAAVATLKNGHYDNIVASLAKGTAASDDAAGNFTTDLNTWSGGSYHTVADVQGADGPLDTKGSASGSGQPFDQNASGDIDGFLKSQAPEIAKALGDPAVASLLGEWGRNKLSDQQFQDDLEQTSWWKNTPVNQRQDLVTRATDPATAAQTLANNMAAIQTQATKFGVGLTAQQAQQLAVSMQANGWSADQVNQNIAKYANYQSGTGTYTGETAADIATLKGIYNAFALPVTDQTLDTQLKGVLGGTMTTQDIQSQVAEQAANFYASNPQLAQYLSAGKGTVAQWADPLVSQAANLLGTDANNINLMSPQWSFLLKPTTDPSSGQSTGQAMTLDGLEQKIKTDPTFQYSTTANGIKDYQDLTDKLQQTFAGGGV